MELIFPNSPTVGQVFNSNGGSWTWSGTTWEVTAGLAATLAIVKSGLPAAGWQVVGDQLICWGIDTTQGNAAQRVTFPRQFKTSVPTVQVTPISSTGLRRTAHLFAVSATFADIVCLDQLDAQAAMAFHWIAIGEALDADKMPKTIQTAGGVGFFATNAEAIAGVVTDKLMSPALVQARQGFIDSNSLTGKTSFNFTGIPAEATEIEVLTLYAGPNIAGGLVAYQPNGLSANYVSQGFMLKSTGVTAFPAQSTAIVVNLPGATDNVAGRMRLVRGLNLWTVDGIFRLAGDIQLTLMGTVATTAITSLLMTCGGPAFPPFAVGSAHLRWRI